MPTFAQSPTIAPTRWIAAEIGSLLWWEVGEDYVLFHRPSSKTHFVNRATFLLLDQVLSDPVDLATAAARLARAQRLPAGDTFLREVEALLVRLEQLGLVERA